MKYWLWVLLGLGWTMNVSAGTGEEVYKSNCSSCHGASGQGSELIRAPRIAGFSTSYIERQLLNYQKGLRGSSAGDIPGKMMVSVVSNLSTDELTRVSEYVSRLALVEIEPLSGAASFRGRGLYSGCASCHGGQGEGYPELGAPRLNHQYDWYLARQLTLFRSGQRGNHERDDLGQQMRAMAQSIASDDDIAVLVNHISTLGAH